MLFPHTALVEVRWHTYAHEQNPTQLSKVQSLKLLCATNRENGHIVLSRPYHIKCAICLSISSSRIVLDLVTDPFLVGLRVLWF